MLGSVRRVLEGRWKRGPSVKGLLLILMLSFLILTYSCWRWLPCQGHFQDLGSFSISGALDPSGWFLGESGQCLGWGGMVFWDFSFLSCFPQPKSVAVPYTAYFLELSLFLFVVNAPLLCFYVKTALPTVITGVVLPSSFILNDYTNWECFLWK